MTGLCCNLHNQHHLFYGALPTCIAAEGGRAGESKSGGNGLRYNYTVRLLIQFVRFYPQGVAYNCTPTLMEHVGLYLR